MKSVTLSRIPYFRGRPEQTPDLGGDNYMGKSTHGVADSPFAQAKTVIGGGIHVAESAI
jgi:hypothetical protein